MFKSMLKEFRDFAFKGNLIDMAVGVIIGGAFGTVIKSLVDDIFMPILGLVTGGLDFKDKYVTLKGTVPPGATLDQAKEAGATLLTYGNFISSFISFMIVALAIFLVIVKVVGALTKRKEEAATAPSEPTTEEKMLVVLNQIRDKIA